MSVPPQPAAGADPSMEDILASIRRILSEDEAPAATQPAPGAPHAPPAPPTAGADAGDVFALDASMLVDDPPAPSHPAPAAATQFSPPVAPAPASAPPASAPPAPAPVFPAPAIVAIPPVAAEPSPPPHGESAPAAFPHEGGAAELADLMDFDPPPRVTPPPPRSEPPSPAALPPAPATSSVFDEEEGLVAPEAAAAAASSMGSLIRRLAAERATPVYRGGPTVEDLVRDEMRPMLKEWLDAHLPAMVERLVRAEIERVVSGSLR